MKLGIALLILAYGFSQFYRAFLAVMAPALEQSVGAGPDDLAFASGIWFLAFAASQLLVGAALDRIGPKLTTAFIFGLGAAGGALLFSQATAPSHIHWAMALIGFGCSPILMAGYYIFAKTYSPAVFATLAGLMLGLGSLGNLASAAPTAWAITTFGWRETMFGLAILTAVMAIILWFTVQDPDTEPTRERGSLLDLLRIRALWPLYALVFVNYAPAAGLRGLWTGPYVQDVFGADVTTIGNVTLAMGIAMILGNFACGRFERFFGSRKWVVFGGTGAATVALWALVIFADAGIVTATLLLVVVGFGGSFFPLLVAHGRAFMPAHLTGRGISLINLFGIGGVSLAQFATAPLHRYGQEIGTSASTPYVLIFALFGVTSLIGLAAYWRVQDRMD